MDNLADEQYQIECFVPEEPVDCWRSQIFAGSLVNLAWVKWYWEEGACLEALCHARQSRLLHVRARKATLDEFARGILYQQDVDSASRFREKFETGNRAPTHFGVHPIP